MKVLQVNKFLYPKGGSETYMFQLSNALKEQGIEIDFWGMQDERNIVSDTYESFVKNVNYQQTSISDKLKIASKTIYSAENRKKIALILDQFKPDLVHLHNYNFQLTPAILPEIKKRGIKIVQTVHDSQMVCPYHRLYNFQKESTCTKCVSGSFLNCFKDQCFDGSYFKSMIGAIESSLYHSQQYYQKYIDQFIFPSKFLAKLVSKKIKNKHFEIIPNFTERIGNINKNQGDYYLYYGRISNEKGILDFTDWFKDTYLKLIIIGSGNQEEVLKNKILSINNISFLGPKYGPELFKYVANAKYVVQPAKGLENCPMTIIESFAYGTPVITANHSGFKDLIEHEKTGYLLDFNNFKEIKNQFLKIDQFSTDSLKENIHDFYQVHLKKEKHISKILEVYQKVLKE